MGMAIFNIATIIIGIISFLVNILIARYNVGKNRTIYDVEEIRVDNLEVFNKLKAKLNKGEYTVLTTYADPKDPYYQTKIYVLGKIKK